MNITPEVLLFLFSQKHTILYQNIRNPGFLFQGIRLYDPKEKPDKAYLYVISEDALSRLPEEERQAFSMLFVSSKKTKPDKKSSSSYQNLNLAVAGGFPNPGSLFYALQQQYQTLLQQENELLLATLDPEHEEMVFAFGKNWFPWEYSIVDIDMRLLYRTDRLHEVTGSGEVERVPAESILELILNRGFHEAAKREDVFYQSTVSNNHIVMARNILLDGRYAGRIVMFLPSTLTEAPEGARSLFLFFTDSVREMLHRSGHFTGRTQNDPLHQLCRSSLNGETVPAHVVNEGLSRSGWKKDHLYSVVVFRFLADSVWEAQMETTLPYLADELELGWPFSCAIIADREIEWVLNYSLSGGSINPDSLHQQIARFVRDHICHAGLSPLFQNFSLLPDARKSALAALKIGQKNHPDFWYFTFDDYRLDYTKEVLQNALPSEFLKHPALAALEEYDRKNHTDLSETLKAYLHCGRNMTAAADAIYIHRTTFCRRMDQIKKITGLDLNDPDTALLLELSYQLDS